MFTANGVGEILGAVFEMGAVAGSELDVYISAGRNGITEYRSSDVFLIHAKSSTLRR